MKSSKKRALRCLSPDQVFDMSTALANFPLNFPQMLFKFILEHMQGYIFVNFYKDLSSQKLIFSIRVNDEKTQYSDEHS